MNFDAVIPALLELGLTDPIFRTATQIAVVRDAAGRVRLALDACADRAKRQTFEEELKARLGGWYFGPSLFKSGEAAERRLAIKVLEKAQNQWPAGWPTVAMEDAIREKSTPIDLERWGGLQRVLSKESWLSGRKVDSPWPLRKQTPTIVSFYSYKGGVGRSTLVAVVAALLARAGDNVVVVDLDLEAPGQQALFEVEADRGVLDYLVEHLALGKSDITGLLTNVPDYPILGMEEAMGTIRLAAAGKTGWSYVEKIARLDFVGHTHSGESPVQAALKALLCDIKKAHQTDWILIDARTGIHDLGGLAVHALAHVDVFLARHGRQGRDGLNMCLEALARRRSADDILTLVVHAMVPPPLTDKEISKPIQDKFRSNVYELFAKALYSSIEDEELPAEADVGAAHTPHAIPMDATLARLEKLSDMLELIDRPHYHRIVERLRQLSSPPDEDS